MTAADVTAALTSAEFVKEVIMAVAKGFNTEEPVDLEVVLPEALMKDLEPFVTKEIANVLKGQVEASFTKKIAGGFTIGPKDGGYFISFTEETFNALISEYLRPATKKILFG
jgi:V/A-type H+-transporting ATPase subunit E